MEILKVGERYAKFEGVEGAMVNIDNTGVNLIVRFKNPSSKEIEQFSSKNKFELRFINIKNILFFTAKIGDLEWIDAPYSPHLSKNFELSPLENEKEGLALNLIFVDCSDGEIKAMRLIGLSNKFSISLIKEVNKLKESKFDKDDYMMDLSNIFNTYSTKEIISMSKDYFKIK